MRARVQNRGSTTSSIINFAMRSITSAKEKDFFDLSKKKKKTLLVGFFSSFTLPYSCCLYLFKLNCLIFHHLPSARPTNTLMNAAHFSLIYNQFRVFSCVFLIENISQNREKFCKLLSTSKL